MCIAIDTWERENMLHSMVFSPCSLFSQHLAAWIKNFTYPGVVVRDFDYGLLHLLFISSLVLSALAFKYSWICRAVIHWQIGWQVYRTQKYGVLIKGDPLVNTTLQTTSGVCLELWWQQTSTMVAHRSNNWPLKRTCSKKLKLLIWLTYISINSHWWSTDDIKKAIFASDAGAFWRNQTAHFHSGVTSLNHWNRHVWSKGCI